VTGLVGDELDRVSPAGGRRGLLVTIVPPPERGRPALATVDLGGDLVVARARGGELALDRLLGALDRAAPHLRAGRGPVPPKGPARASALDVAPLDPLDLRLHRGAEDRLSLFIDDAEIDREVVAHVALALGALDAGIALGRVLHHGGAPGDMAVRAVGDIGLERELLRA